MSEKRSLRIESKMQLIKRISIGALLLCITPAAHAQKVYNIVDFGAKGDGITSNTIAFQKTINRCSKNGGGTVLIPQGNFLTGSVQLFSDINLHLAAGAKLVGVKDNREYLYQNDFGFSGMGAGNKTGILFAVNAENISVTGYGIIDGQGDFSVYPDSLQNDSDLDYRYTRQGKDYMNPQYGTADGPLMWKGTYDERPGVMVIFSNCKNVSIANIVFKDAPNWTIAFHNSNNIKINAVTINNNMLIPNNDGIDFYDCKNAQVSDCHISAGDDGIAIMSSGNISVSNCTLHSRSAGIRIGGNNVYNDKDSNNLLFSNINIYDSNRGIGIFQRRRGNISHVMFSNILIQTRLHTGQWWGHGEPVHISAVPGTGVDKAGTISHVTFSHVVASGEAGIVLYGSAESVLEKVYFSDCEITLRNGPLTKHYGGNFDLRPAGDIKIRIFKHDIPAIYAQYVKDISFANLSVHWDRNMPEFFTSAIVCKNFENLTITNFLGGANKPELPAISLQNGKCLLVSNLLLNNKSSKIIEKREVK